MIEALLTPKDKIVSLTESFTCQDAIQLLESKGVRCAPVLDATGQIFRGNIYRYHLYQHQFRYPDTDLSKLPVTQFIKNTTKVVRLSDSFIHLFFTMSDLPQIAVLNEDNAFVGLIYHNRLMRFLEKSWLTDRTKYILQVQTSNQTGELGRITKYINRYTDIIGSITFEETSYNTASQVYFTLPSSLDLVKLHELERTLTRKHYPCKHYTIK